MTGNKAAFYFANLGADVQRCATAAEEGNAKEYESSLKRARRTLSLIEKENRPEAYEEGLLLLRALEYARASRSLGVLQDQLTATIQPFATRLGFS